MDLCRVRKVWAKVQVLKCRALMYGYDLSLRYKGEAEPLAMYSIGEMHNRTSIQ